MMENITIKCYGAIRKHQKEVEQAFAWEKITESVPMALRRQESNPSAFSVIQNGRETAMLVLHGRKIIVHPGNVLDRVIPVLEEAVSKSLDCRCAIHGGWRNNRFTVSLFIPEQRSCAGLHTGDRLVFGRYRLDQGREERPVTWRVLDICEEEALLISEEALIRAGYCDAKKAYGNPWYLMWGNSLARELCNGVFYYKAFDYEERSCIIPQRIEDAEQGPACVDEVFLLSEEQARLFFKDAEDRMTRPSRGLLEMETASPENRLMHGYGENKANISWWLLPEERGEIFPKAVFPDGIIQYHGRNSYHSDFSIRPCIVVRLNDIFRIKARKDIRVTNNPVTNTPVSNPPDQSRSLRFHIKDLFYMTFRKTEKGESWSFDFEKAEDSHYEISDGQIEKLTRYLQQILNSKEEALNVLITIWMKEYLRDSSRLESSIVTLLCTAGAAFSQFHFD